MRFEPTTHSLIVTLGSPIDEEIISSLYLSEPIKVIGRSDDGLIDCYQLKYKDIASVSILLVFLKLLGQETYWAIGRDKKIRKRRTDDKEAEIQFGNKEAGNQFGFVKRATEDMFFKSTDCLYCETDQSYWTTGEFT
tara:strand:- start:62 stop:472 length:411 start_codon:yes stop_codon:yes gene_type:complete